MEETEGTTSNTFIIHERYMSMITEIKHSLWKKTGEEYKNGLGELNEIIRITEEKTAELRNRKE